MVVAAVSDVSSLGVPAEHLVSKHRRHRVRCHGTTKRAPLDTMLIQISRGA